jgi:hypothetical protein
MAQLSDLEQVGQQTSGDQLDPNIQTPGGQNDLVFTRTYKVNSNVVKNYTYQILDSNVRITDATISNAYLVHQRAVRLDEVNMHLICTFAQIPSTWQTDATYEAVTFPGVAPSSLYVPDEFEFRSGPTSFDTQVRKEHAYFLGPQSGIATFERFKPVDAMTGLRVSTITDFTVPSSDQYISLVQGRGEIVVSSVVMRWKGDIWDRTTKYALAK